MSRDSTGPKVEIAFGCLVALLIGVGWLGLSRMGQINASTNRLFGERWEKLYTTRLAASYFNTNNRFIMRSFLREDANNEDASSLAAQTNENTLKASAAWKQIETQPISPEERELLAKITTAELPADESLKRTWSLLVKQGKTAEVNKSLVNETLPLLNKYRDAWVSFTDYEEDQLNRARRRALRVMRSSGAFPRHWYLWR